jgi:hypothetical protein
VSGNIVAQIPVERYVPGMADAPSRMAPPPSRDLVDIGSYMRRL